MLALDDGRRHARERGWLVDASPVPGVYERCDDGTKVIHPYRGLSSLGFTVGARFENDRLNPRFYQQLTFGSTVLSGDGLEEDRLLQLYGQCYAFYSRLTGFMTGMANDLTFALPSVIKDIDSGSKPSELSFTVECGMGASGTTLRLAYAGTVYTTHCFVSNFTVICLGGDGSPVKQLRNVSYALTQAVKDYIVQNCQKDLNAVAARIKERGVIYHPKQMAFEGRGFRMSFGNDYSYDNKLTKCVFIRYRTKVGGSSSREALCKMSAEGMAGSGHLTVLDRGRQVEPISKGAERYLMGALQESWAVVSLDGVSKDAVCRCQNPDAVIDITVPLPLEDESYASPGFEWRMDYIGGFVSSFLMEFLAFMFFLCCIACFRGLISVCRPRPEAKRPSDKSVRGVYCNGDHDVDGSCFLETEKLLMA